MTAEQLRNSILQEAISGRLVPQDPNDEPASVLLEKIRAEKARLIKEGKLKKEKPSAPITDDEKPFEVPATWEWIRIKQAFNVCSARRVHEKDWRSSGIPFYRAREIGKLAEYGHVDNDLYIEQELYNEFSKSGVPQENDLMVTAVGTLGRVYVVKANEIFYYKDGSVLCMENRFGLNPKFAKLVIESPVFINQYIGESQGTTVATLTMVRMNEYLFPLPPLAEQQRIVAKLEELLPIVEQYGKAQTELDELNAALPARLRQSVLQQAIQGKLVPQDPNEGTAEELLKQIEEEKVRLQIKKNKKVETLTLEEAPFDIPETWHWCLLGELAAEDMGKTPPRGEIVYWANAKYPWVSIADMKDYGHIKTTKEAVSEYATEKAFRDISPAGSLLMSFKLTVGRTSILDIDAYHNEAIITIKPFVDNEYAFRNYLFYILPLIANMGDSKDAIKGKTLNSTSLYTLPIPLPPLAEQKRIAAKIEELFAEIDKMK